MKLVEILAKELIEWHDRTERLHQDGDGRIYATCRKMPKFHKEWNEWDVSGHEVIMNGEDPIYGDCLDLADDYKTNVVTRAQWQAERDRQKGGEWKRHRGGKQPVADDVVVEYKLRNGYTDKWHARALGWSHAGGEGDVMKYRVISQPQAEGVEVTNEKILKPAIDALENMTAQWQQSSGPLAWRDTIIHCQAIIEDCERDIQRNVDLLDAEGLMIQADNKKAMQHYAPDVDMSDWRNWKVGDIVEVIIPNDGELPIGKQYTVCEIEAPEYEGGMMVKVFDDEGESHWPEDDKYEGRMVFKFIRRP